AHAKRVVKIKDGLVVSDDPNEEQEWISRGRGAAAASTADIELKHADLSMAELCEYAASAARAMAANKVRSALSMLGILIGVGAVIAMLAVGKGAQQAIEARISSL